MQIAKGQLSVIGCGMSIKDLTPNHLQALGEADILAGGRRLLDWFPAFRGETFEISSDVRGKVAELLEIARHRRVAVLASGDPLFFGIGSLFTASAADVEITFLPNISAAQLALARLALPWSEARFFSIHGRREPLPWRQILSARTAVIYTDPERHPGVVAGELLELFPLVAARAAAVAEDLGGNESIFKGRLDEIAGREFSGLAVLVLMPLESQGKIFTPALTLGQEDSCFVHQRKLITHPEVRAVALSKLRLGPGVLWDLGAGSGSVAVEACGLCPGLSAYAVEKDPQRVQMIRDNVRRSGLTSCHVILEDILNAMDTLPAPRAIFVGGGGRDVGRIVREAFVALRPGGRLVASAVLLDTKQQLNNSLQEACIENIELEIRRASPVGRGQIMKPENPVSLYIYDKKIA